MSGSVKVRLQTNATKNLTKRLYRGILPTLLSSPTVWIFNFALYQRFLGIFKSDDLWNKFFSGGCAGISWSIIICPFEMVKCYAQRYQVTSTEALRRIRSHLGYSGFYRGFTSCLLRDIPVSSVYFCILEGCRRYIPNYNNSTFLYPFLTGSLCGITSITIGLPADCIKSRIQTNFVESEHGISTSFRHNFSNAVKQNGYLSLYKGIIPVVSRAILNTGCCIVVVEYVNKTFFDGHPSG